MSALRRLGLTPAAFTIEPDYSDAQEQTRQAFGFKWAKRDTYDSPAVWDNHRAWLFERYCDGDPEQLTAWLEGGRKIVLDAGCGSGFSAGLFFGEHLQAHDYLGVDIAGEAIAAAKVRFREQGWPGEFVEGNISALPIPDASVDLIFSSGVLHHTDDPAATLRSLAGKLVPGGRFLFYVYARKAVLRELADDHVRAALQDLDDEEAWEALVPLTKLGMALGELNVALDVPEDIPYLGVEKGRIDLQRFFYWNVCKLFYRKGLTMDEMNHVNFDWYRPLNAHRQTPEEVAAWCEAARLDVERLFVQKSGITVVAQRK